MHFASLATPDCSALKVLVEGELVHAVGVPPATRHDPGLLVLTHPLLKEVGLAPAKLHKQHYV